MAAVSCLPPHGRYSSSDDVVSCCPPVKGMDLDDSSSSSHGSVETGSSGSPGSSVDPNAPSSHGFVSHSSPASDARRSSLSGFSRSSVGTSRSGYGSCKSLVSSSFGFIMMFIFILGMHTVTAIECSNLKLEDATHDNFLACTESLVSLIEDNGSYPIIDISNFTQENFNEFSKVKGDVGASRRFKGNLRVVGSELETITIRLYSDNEIPKSFELKNNPRLKEVDLRGSNILQGQIYFNIRGNKILSNGSLEAMRTADYRSNDSYFQDFGECDFNNNTIKAFDDLQFCHFVVGHLIVNDQTDLTSSEQLHKEIAKTLTSIERGGCLKIINSNLESLGFLGNFRNLPCGEIEGNKKLCLHPQELKELTQRLGSVTYKDNQDCKGVCSPKYLMEERDTTCKIISNTLSIMGIDDSDDLKHLHQVEEIRGRLLIMNNGFTDLNFFPNLETVDATSDPGDAIEIRFNNNMTSIDFPKLKNITTTAAAQVFVYENEHPVNPALVDRLNKDYKGKVTVVKQSTAPIINNTIINRTIEEVDPEKAGTLLETWEIAVIATGVSGGLLLIIILVLIILAVRHEKKAQRYATALRANFKFSDAELVSYPNKDNLVTWMPEAKAIMEENVELIKQQDKALAELKAKDKKIMFFKNEEATVPFFSRANNNREIAEKDKNDPEPIYAHKLNRSGETCNPQCKYFKNDLNVSHAVCPGECVKCNDFGIAIENTGKKMFGVRMEKTEFEHWNKEDMEICHEFYFQNMPIGTFPIVHEQPFAEVTAKRMGALPSSMIADELQFLAEIEEKKPRALSIYAGKQLKFLSPKDEKKAAEEKQKYFLALQLPTRACVFRFTISLHQYTPDPKLLDDITKIKLKSSSFFNWFKDKNFSAVQNMITAHMNAPLNRWVTNYTAENIIKLCENTKKALFDETIPRDAKKPIGYSSVINLDLLNVRIIGEIRGHFDDLRRGLCLPSVNADKNSHPATSVKHVFLGNYVGAGGSNLEVLCLLFSLKCRFPKNYILLRGAMEWREMDLLSGLRPEISFRFPDEKEDILNAIYEVFDHLPLICLIGKNAVCVSGGVPPGGFRSVKEIPIPIKELEPDTTPFNIMFALPNYTVKRFFDNVEQNAGYYFGQGPLNTCGYDVIFCSKVLKSGFGVFKGTNGRLYSLCGYRYQNRPDYRIAQAEYNELGELTFHVIMNEHQEKEEWDPDAQFKEANEHIKSQMTQVKQLSMMGKVEAPKDKSKEKKAEQLKSEQKPPEAAGQAPVEDPKKAEPAEKTKPEQKPVPKTNETQKTEPASKAPEAPKSTLKKEASIQGGAKSDKAAEVPKSTQKKEVSVQGGNKSGAQPSKK